MIALDSSSIIAFCNGQSGKDVDATIYALEQEQAVLPPVVLTEILSDPRLPKSISQIFLDLPLLQITPGFWERTGRLRATLIDSNYKARLADSLIAQVCIDNECPLITRERDFKAFTKFSSFKLLVE